MTTYDFQQLLFVFSLLIMTIDGNIHQKEMDLNEDIYYKIETDEVIPYKTITNMLLINLKDNPVSILNEHFQTLDKAAFTDEEKTEFLETAYDMIHADNMVHPSEWEFLLLSKNKLGITDADFRKEFPEYSADDKTVSSNPDFLDELLNSLDFSQLKPVE